MILSAIGLYAGRVNARAMRDSSTWLQSMTALISGTARNDGFSRSAPPVRVVGDEAGTAGRRLVVDDPVHGQRQGLQHLALLDHRDPLERIDEVGVDREQPYELVQPLVHVAVEPG